MWNQKFELARLQVFRKWSRKGYSLFMMLNKIVKIGVLTLTYHNVTASIHNNFIINISDTTEIYNNIDLDEIVVSANRVPLIYSEIARIVHVVPKTELAKRPGNNLSDILRQFHAVDIRQRGPEGIQADLSLRGGSFDQTAILLNGINITDPQTGHHNLNIPLSFSNIDRIEILEGPAARVYGPNAFSGAINIITKTENKNALTTSYTRGSFNLSELDLAATIKTGIFSHALSMNRKKSDGYINNTDFNVQNTFFQSSGNNAFGQIDYQIGYTNKQFGANAFYTPRFPDQFEQIRTLFTSLRFKSNSPLHLTPSVYWRRHHDRFELFRYEWPSWYKGHNYHLTDVFGATISSWFMTPIGKTSLGAELRSENIWSNVLGTQLVTMIKVPGQDAEFTKFKSRSSFSVFAEHNLNLYKFFLSAGILVQRNSELELNWKIYPGIDISYNIIPNIKWFASTGKSLRLPTFTDLYYSGPTNIGNPELKPEETVQIETGLKYFRKGINGHINIYTLKGINLIDWVKLPGEEIWQTSNHTEIVSRGYQIYFRFDFNRLVKNNFPISYISTGYNYSILKKEYSELISYYVLDNLKQKFTLNIEHRLAKNLYSSWSTIYQDRNGSYSKYFNGQITEKEYEPFWLIDWKISYIREKMEIYISATNLLNAWYIDFGNIEQPGRWIKSGIRIKID